MATIRVGPQQDFKTPLDACERLGSGDTLEIEAGTYVNGLIGIPKGINRVTIRGVGPYGAVASLQSESPPGKMPPTFGARRRFNQMSNKGICVIEGNDVTLENLKFSGARSYQFNGAGIRHSGTNLTVKKCVFDGNEDGILGSEKDDPRTAGVDEGGRVWIEECEFVRNGVGSGQAHNVYFAYAKELIFYRNNSHASKVGHLFKGRAHTTLLLENRLHDEDGTGSFIADVNGGRAYLINNDIEKGLNSQNKYTVINYYLQEYNPTPPHNLIVRGNRIKNLLTVKGAAIVRVRDEIYTLTREPFVDDQGRKRLGPVIKTPLGSGEITGRIADNTIIYAPMINRLGQNVSSDFLQTAFVVPPGVVVEDSNRFLTMDVETPLQRSVELTPENLSTYLDSLK